jgi:D-sedoheptulose 7-phosphate isomerase
MTHTKILEKLIARHQELAPIGGDILAAYELLADCFQGGGKLLVGGNGGSAADAEHIAGELMKCFEKKRPLSDAERAALLNADAAMGARLADMLVGTLPVISLTGHTALSTATMNDCDAVAIFAQQVWGYGGRGDVLLAISTSGNAENLLLAATAARARGMKIILLTGKDGGKLKAFADVAICAPADKTFLVQELHLPIYHALCMMLEDHFFTYE